MKFLYLTLPAFLLLAACASLSEDQCRGGDWERIGFRDGANGRNPGFLTTHAKACAEYGIAPQPAAWEAGRQEGLTLYCTPRNAFEEGRRGTVFRDVCPIEVQGSLERANREGLRLREIEDDIRDAEREIARINRRLAELPEDDPSRAALIRERAALRLDILSLRTSRARYRFY